MPNALTLDLAFSTHRGKERCVYKAWGAVQPLWSPGAVDYTEPSQKVDSSGLRLLTAPALGLHIVASQMNAGQLPVIMTKYLR